jgi:hypothetical protein
MAEILAKVWDSENRIRSASMGGDTWYFDQAGVADYFPSNVHRVASFFVVLEMWVCSRSIKVCSPPGAALLASVVATVSTFVKIDAATISAIRST